MYNPRMLVFISMIILSVSTAQAQDIKKLPMDAAISYALEHNPSLRYFDNMIAGKENEKLAVRKSRNGYFQFESGVTGTTEPGNAAFIKVKQGAFDQAYQVNEMNSPTDTVWTVFGIIKYLRPLSTGGKIRSIQEQKEIEKSILRYQKLQAQSQIIHQVIKTYLNLSMVLSEQEITEQSIVVATKNRDQVDSLLKKGMALKSDLLNADLRVLKYKERLQEISNRMKVVKKSLLYLMGYSYENTDFVPENILCMNVVSDSIESMVETAFKSRWEIRMFEEEMRKIDHQIEEVKSENRFTSNLIASYEINQAENFDYDGNGYLAGIQFVRKFGDSGVLKNKIKAFMEAKKGLRYQLKALKDKIRFEITQSFFEVENSTSMIKLMDKTLEAAEESYSLIRDQYENGIVKFLEVMDAELEVSQARQRRLLTLHQHCIKMSDLKYQTGELKKGFKK